MNKVFPLSLATNIFLGYSLHEALEIIAKKNFHSVEIASIDGVCEHIPVSVMTEETSEEVKQQLNDCGLSSYAFSGHVDLTEPVGVKDFLRKMEFAKSLGSKIINTNAGPINRINEFKENIKLIIQKAEDLELMIGLESHGDIISSAGDSLHVLREINHPLVKMNYDTGNVFYHSQGKVLPDEDILKALDFISYVHLKDIKVDGSDVTYCALGDGSINLAKVLAILNDYGRTIPISFEIPVFLHCTDWQPLQKAPVPLSLENINTVIDRSLLYVKQFIAVV